MGVQRGARRAKGPVARELAEGWSAGSVEAGWVVAGGVYRPISGRGEALRNRQATVESEYQDFADRDARLDRGRPLLGFRDDQ